MRVYGKSWKNNERCDRVECEADIGNPGAEPGDQHNRLSIAMPGNPDTGGASVNPRLFWKMLTETWTGICEVPCHAAIRAKFYAQFLVVL